MAWVKPVTTVEMALHTDSANLRFETAVRALSPLAYWKLNDVSSPIMRDGSGNSRHGTYENAPLQGQPGVSPELGPAVSFDGVSQHALATDDGHDTGAISVVMIASGTAAAGLSTAKFSLRKLGAAARFYIGDAYASTGITILTTTGTPYVLIGTWDGTLNADGIKLYANGTLVGTATATKGFSGDTFYISRQGSTYYEGIVQHVAVFGSALSQTNVTDLQTAATTVWTDVSADLADDPIEFSYGIKSHRPEVRCAETGVGRFSLINSVNNSTGTAGKYSIGHSSKLTGFDFRIPVRIKQYDGTNTRYFRGTLEVTQSESGTYDAQKTYCEIVDWMDDAARTDAPAAIQISQTSGQVATALLSCASRPPAALSIADGVSTFPYALDNVDSETKLITALGWLADSESGLVYAKRDATHGQTVVFEDRHQRVSGSLLITLDNTMHELELSGAAADILNAIKVTAFPRLVVSGLVIGTIGAPFSAAVAPGETVTIFVPYTDPANRATAIGGTAHTTPASGTDYVMNSASDGSGTNLTSSFTVVPAMWSTSTMFVITNAGTVPGYITTLQQRGSGVFSLTPTTALSEDADSIARYGKNAVAIEMLYEANPYVAASAAAYYKSIHKNPLAHVRRVVFVANQSAALLTAAITGDISDRVALVETINGLTAATIYHINAVEHSTDDQETLTCAWWLTPANTTRFWQLGVTGASEIGQTTVLGF